MDLLKLSPQGEKKHIIQNHSKHPYNPKKIVNVGVFKYKNKGFEVKKDEIDGFWNEIK